MNDVIHAPAAPEVPQIESPVEPRPEDLEWAEAMFAEWERRFACLRRETPALRAKSTPTAG